MQKQSNLSRQMEYAGSHRYFTYASWILSALSALITLVPFWYIWNIIHFLIAGGLLFTQNGVTTTFLLNLIFYIIIMPVISLTLTRIMF